MFDKNINSNEYINNISTATNDLKEIKILLSNTKEEYNNKKSLIKSDKFDSLLSSIIIFIVTTLLSSSNIFLVAGILLFILSSGIYIKSSINDKKLENEFNRKNVILEKMLKTQRKKINRLKRHNKNINFSETLQEKNIDRKNYINKLYKKLDLIHYYSNNSKKLDLIYNKYGKQIFKIYLSQSFYDDEINFIILLIEEKNKKELNINVKNKEKKLGE